MGLFGKKKKNSSEQYEKIMASMFAPKFPEIQDQWILDHQIDFPAESIFRNSKFTYADAWFNVEVAAMMVATQIPIACETCEDLSSCQKCGKADSNYLKFMTANADGDYLGWSLTSNEEYNSRMLSDGFFVSFDKSVEGTFSNDQYLSFKSQKLAPIILKEFDVKAYASNIGMIFVGDAYAHLDGKDFISGLRVPEGKYQVIVWMGYTMSGDIAPMACTILGVNFVDNLDFKCTNFNEVPENIKNSIIGSESQNVLARFDQNLGQLADMNASLYDLNDPVLGYIGASWGIQYLLHSDPREFESATAEALQSDPSGMLSAIDSLRIRGQHKVSMELLDLLEKYGKDFTETHQMMIRVFRKFPPGSFGVNE